MRFNCGRTCAARVEECRFAAVLAAVGPVRVFSHTVSVKVEFRDPGGLKAAVEAMGGRWIGEGTHKMFEGSSTGLGFRLPGWNYPLVLRSDGSLAFDDYRGMWGNVADLERLKAEYAVGVAEERARELGWLSERSSEGLTIYHPGGGSLLVTAAGVEAMGFQGIGCAEATRAIAEALGAEIASSNKPEMNMCGQNVNIKGGA